MYSRNITNQSIKRYEGKSEKFKIVSKECDAAILEAKKVFFDKIIEKVKKYKNSGPYYKSVGMLQTKEAPTPWAIQSMYPGATDLEIAEDAAAFFNAISQEYDPLPDPSRAGEGVEHIQRYQVAARLRSFRKPKSIVPGDINPALIAPLADILAEPLAYIYNRVLDELEWPLLWKTETVHLIPKNNSPAGLAELRNLSCTPLFSKILESFVLDRLKEQVKLSDKQFGGIKGCSTNHFLIKTWDDILSSLEEPDSAVSLISIDFEKAFNRLDHTRCLEALVDLGADMTVVDWVAAFLHGRQMSVKVNKARSAPRTVPGGSPQGSILGNFLFCATTNAFANLNSDEPTPDILSDTTSSDTQDSSEYSSCTSNELRTETAVSTPTARGQFFSFRPPACLADLTGDYSPEESGFDFFRQRRSNFLDSSSSEEEIQRQITINIPNSRSTKPISSVVYIDDYNAIEQIKVGGAISHITTRKQHLKVHARQSELLFERVNDLATELNMRVNKNKTQLLCMNASKHSEVQSFIRSGNTEIISSDSLKILGFNFNKNPSANYHVSIIIEKFYNKLWTLRFLKRSGLSKERLLQIYYTVILPSVEYSSVVYHSLIPDHLADKLELVQKQALKIIFGWHLSFNEIVELHGIETLKQRREKEVLKFATKQASSDRFSSWFPLSEQHAYNTRPANHRKYRETFTRNKRMKDNPLTHMRRILNEQDG